MKIYSVVEYYEYPPRSDDDWRLIEQYDNVRSALLKKGYLEHYNDTHIKYEVIEDEVQSSALVVGFPQFNRIMNATDEELQELYDAQVLK